MEDDAKDIRNDEERRDEKHKGKRKDPVTIEFPDDYVVDTGPWHVKRDRLTGEVPDRPTTDNITESPEWRNYSDGTKGLIRSNSNVSVIVPPDMMKVIYTGRVRGISPSTRSMMHTPFERKERKKVEAINLLRDVLVRLDLMDNKMIKALASNAVRTYMEKRFNEGATVQRREIAYLVAAVILEIVQSYGLAISKNNVIEAVASSTYSRVNDADEIRNNIWKMLKKLNDTGITNLIRKNRAEVRRARLCTVARRSMNFVNDIVTRMYINDKKKKYIINIAKYIIEKSVKNGKSLQGKMAEAIAAASVYIAARLVDVNVNQKDVAMLVNISETNVRKAFRFLVENQVILVIPNVVEEPGYYGMGAKPVAKPPV